LTLFLTTLATYHSAISIHSLRTYIFSITQTCKALYAEYSASAGTYHGILNDMLSKQHDLDAIRLEACRAIISSFSGAGGDILRMGANAVREGQSQFTTDPHGRSRSSGERISKRFFLSQFSLDDRDVFQDTLSDMFEFLMKPASLTPLFWKDKLNLTQAVSISTKAGFVVRVDQKKLALNKKKRNNKKNIKTPNPSPRRHSSPRQLSLIEKASRHVSYPSANNQHNVFRSSSPLSHSHDEVSSRSERLRAHQNVVLAQMQSELVTLQQASHSDHPPIASSVRSYRERNQVTRNSKKSSSQKQSAAAALHITQHMWGEERRRNLLYSLSQDPNIGPILDLVSSILLLPLPINSADSSIDFPKFESVK
jgi:hypothetical protein